eukprot:CAMPEP_0196995338 /NCGR_PEP_ID=MMETSP1380-20130617/1480_1 /TAXON_ID=5936 /ORGANISM="Euplotes crassus, Strain CT5" /LENGTH=30 /DNA_ID= /DNA_START= /DNA_END= /DNA_ORIENTATION=
MTKFTDSNGTGDEEGAKIGPKDKIVMFNNG